MSAHIYEDIDYAVRNPTYEGQASVAHARSGPPHNPNTLTEESRPAVKVQVGLY